MTKHLKRINNRSWLICLSLLMIVCSAVGITVAKYTTQLEVGSFDLTIQTKEGAYAVYSADDNSLEFFYGRVPSVGGTSPTGKTVTAVYTDIEEKGYSRGWSSYAANIKTVTFHEGITKESVPRKIQPLTMNSWFKDFTQVTSFNFNGLDTSNVTSMYYTFNACSSLKELNVTSFNTSNVTSMRGMFLSCSSLEELDVTNFNTSKVTSMREMFQACKKLKALDVSNFDTSKVTTMQHMFSVCYSLETLDLSNFITTKVENMSFMFSNEPGNSKLKHIDLSSFNTYAVTNMNQMFRYCEQLTILDLQSFDTTNLKSMQYMFIGCSELMSIYVDATRWNLSNVRVENSDKMFEHCEKIVGSNGTTYDAAHINKTYAIIDGTDGNKGYLSGKIVEAEVFYAVYGDAFNTAGEPLGKGLYFYKRELPSLDESTRIDFTDGYQIVEESYSEFTAAPWSTYASTISVVKIVDEINPTSTASWFNGFNNCASFVDLSKLKTANVTSMANMFKNCVLLSDSDLSTFTIDTASAKNLNGMFHGCTSLTNSNGNTFNFINSAVAADANAAIVLTDLRNMFKVCEALKKIDLTNLYISQNNVNFAYMFYQCVRMTDVTFSDREIWTFAPVSASGSRVQSGTAYMFANCHLLKELDISFIKCQTSSAQEMFSNCYAITKIEADLAFAYKDNVSGTVSMFANCDSLVGGNGMTFSEAEALQGSTSINSVHARIDGHDGFAGYLTGKHDEVTHAAVDVDIVDDAFGWDYATPGQHAFYANSASIVNNKLKIIPKTGETPPESVTVTIDGNDMTADDGITYSCTDTEGTLEIPAKLLNLNSTVVIAAPSTYGLLNKKAAPIYFDISSIDDMYLVWFPISEHEDMMPYPNEDYQIEFMAYDGYELPETITVEIDGTVYDVATSGANPDGEPEFDNESGILTIPAELLTKETKSLVITVSAIPVADQPEQKPADTEKTDEAQKPADTEKTDEAQKPADGNNAESTMQNAEIKAELENAEIKGTFDEDGNAELVIKANEGYKLPETFMISIGGTEYEIDAAAAEQEDGIVWDSETGTLTIPKDLLSGENAEIGVKLQAIIKEDDGKETDKKPEEDKKTDGENSTENTNDKNNGNTSGGTEGEKPKDETTEGGTGTDDTEQGGNENVGGNTDTENGENGGTENGEQKPSEDTETDTPVIPPVTDGEQTGGTDDEGDGDNNVPPATEETPTTPPVTEDNGAEENGGDTDGEDANPVVPNDKAEAPGEDNKGEDTTSGSTETGGTDDTASGSTESGNDTPQGDTSASESNNSTGESTNTSGSTTGNAPAAPPASESNNNSVATPTAPSTNTQGGDSSQGNSQGSGTTGGTSGGDGNSSSDTSTGTTSTATNTTAKKKTETTGSTGGEDNNSSAE